MDGTEETERSCCRHSRRISAIPTKTEVDVPPKSDARRVGMVMLHPVRLVAMDVMRVPGACPQQIRAEQNPHDQKTGKQNPGFHGNGSLSFQYRISPVSIQQKTDCISSDSG